MKRILIKANGIIPNNGEYIAGIGRTNIELISRFAKIKDYEIEFSIYCPTRRSIGFHHYGWNIPYHAYPFPHNLLLKSNFEAFYRRTFFKHDLLHITSNFDNFSIKEKMVVTIHDLYMKDKDNSWLFDKCVNCSQAIVTCSDFTKQDILNHYPNIDEEKITVIPWGINHNIFYPREVSEVACLKEKYQINGRYFFACSVSNPRKNADVILEAFSKFCETKNDISLVLAWGNPPEKFLSKYAKEIEQRKIIFLSYLEDDELATLYTGAETSLFVSSYEGFGFPILEAMACGTPVITCRNSSLPEIGLDLAEYVKERDVDDMIGCMQAFYDDKIEVPQSKLISHAQSYDWDGTARKYVEFYKKALEL